MTLNWTIANAGGTRNIIPASASATGDARVTRVRDWDTLEGQAARANRQDVGAGHESDADGRAPPSTARGHRRVARAGELRDQHLRRHRPPPRRHRTSGGGGTDAAFAALKTKAPVIEGFGPVGFGAHSDEREFIDLRSVEPRLYLLARLIIDVATGKAPVN